MPLGLLGKKLGMSQIFDQDGKLVPVTYIQAGPCYVVQHKTAASDGYDAIQVGFDEKKEKNVNRPQTGHLKKAGVPMLRHIREFRLNGDANAESLPEVGSTLDVNLFKEGDHIDVVGVSKGRGFTSPIKRWHTARGPESHGSMYHRRAGSQGASSYPSKTWKNKPAAGQHGNSRSAVLNLVVVKADAEKNLLIVRGSVPGHNNSFVMIRPTIRSKKAARQLQLQVAAAERAKAGAKAANPLKASKKGGK